MARKSPQPTEVLPLLYLHGLSTNDFSPTLEQFLSTAAAVSAATVNRLTTRSQSEAIAFNQRSLDDADYVYVWVDGIRFKVRLDQDAACLLVTISVRADGRKELIALVEIYNAEDKDHALKAVTAFTADYGAKHPETVVKIIDSAHSCHQRHRFQGRRDRDAFTLIESAERRCRTVNAPHFVAHTRARATFKTSKLIERPDAPTTETQVAQNQPTRTT